MSCDGHLIGIIFLLGVSLPLFLNGQPFGNGIGGILLLSFSIAICFVRNGIGGRPIEGIVGRTVSALTALAILIIALQLPVSYQAQTRFNESRERASAVDSTNPQNVKP